MINLKMSKEELINKVISDNRKFVVRDLIKKGRINEILTLEYCNYADDSEMLDILSVKTSCIEFMRTVKLNKKWFDFVFNRYCISDFDVEVLDVMVESQSNCFDIEQFDLISEKAPSYKERLLSSDIIKKLDPYLLGMLNDRKLLPENVIYELTDVMAKAVCSNVKFEPGANLTKLQVIMLTRKITDDEKDFYVNVLKEMRAKKEDNFVYFGALGYLLISQQVKEDLVVEVLEAGQINSLPESRDYVDRSERWLLGILRNQNLDNILDLVLDKIENNIYLIEYILEHNTVTSTETLLKLAIKHKDIAFKFNNTGYPILESHKF